MKKSLLFGLLAVLAAVFIFTACDNGTTTTEGPEREVEVPIEIDIVVTTEGELKALFPDPDGTAKKDTSEWKGKVIGLNADITLTANLTIPEGYTVYLFGNKTLATNSTYGITVKGNLEVGAGGMVSVADSAKPIVVTDTGNITIDDEGYLSLYLITDINDGATKPKTVVGDTSKVKVEGGTLILTAFTKLSDLTKAFDSVKSGLLYVDGPKPVKPSDITSLDITENRKITVEVSKTETATSLIIPKGMDLTTYGSLPLVTNLTIDGTFTTTSSLTVLTDLTITGTFNSTGTFPALKTLTVEAGGISDLGTASLPVLGTLIVNGTLDVEDAVLPATSATAVSVTVGETGKLTLDTITLANSTIEGKLVLAAGADVIVGQNAVLTLVNPTLKDSSGVDYITGTGEIIAVGGSGGGTITVGSGEEVLVGYTTDAGGTVGVAGNDLALALKAIDKDFTTLMIRTGLVTAFGTSGVEDVTAIGSTTIGGLNTPIGVFTNGTGATTGIPDILGVPVILDTNSALVQSLVTSTLGTIVKGGTAAADVTEANFTLSVDSGAVKIADGAYATATDKYVIITFKNYLPKNRGLIGPEDYLVSFNIGVITKRA
jgi:hypothetical protein